MHSAAFLPLLALGLWLWRDKATPDLAFRLHRFLFLKTIAGSAGLNP